MNLERKFFSTPYSEGYNFSNFRRTVYRDEKWKELKKIEVSGRKNQSCREFDWDHFYVLCIELGGNIFLAPNGET